MTPGINSPVAAIICVVLAIFFGGAGTSILSISKSRFKMESGLSSFILSVFLSHRAIFIISMLFGYFLSVTCFTFSIAGMTGPLFRDTLQISSGFLITIFQLLVIVILLIGTVLCLRMSIFRVKAESILPLFAIPALLLYLVFYIPSVILLLFSGFLTRYIFGIKGNLRKEGYFLDYSFPEFFTPFFIPDATAEKKPDEEPEVRILQNVLGFSKIKVRDCMVPRNEITALDVNSSIAELRKEFIDSGYSKILIFQGTIDNIIGYISSKELFKNPENIRSKLVSLSVVPETMQINRLFRNLIRERRSIALVVDEFGGTSGIVTLEDIMEEIFGEIEDEHDTPEFIEQQVSENEFILSGRLEIDYLNEKYKLNIPETEDYDTLAGYIIFHHENIPKLNTNVKINDLHMRILKVSQTRIELVKVSVNRF